MAINFRLGEGRNVMVQILVLLIASVVIIFGGFYQISFAQEQYSDKSLITAFVIFGGWACVMLIARLIARRQTLGEVVKLNELDQGNSYQVVKLPPIIAVEEEINMGQRTLRLVDAASIPEEDLPKLIIGRKFDIKRKKIHLHQMYQLCLPLCSQS